MPEYALENIARHRAEEYLAQCIVDYLWKHSTLPEGVIAQWRNDFADAPPPVDSRMSASELAEIHRLTQDRVSGFLDRMTACIAESME